MTFKNCKELQTFLKTGTGLRTVFVDSWEGSVQPPYIVVSKGETQTVRADDKVYAKERRFYITVFAKKNDDETVELVEDLLDESETDYKEETGWLNDLRLEWHEFLI